MQKPWTALAAALASLLLVMLAPPLAHADDVGSTTEYVTISGADDTDLKALVITPTGRPGPHPLLVMPSAWGTNNLLYVGAARRLAYESGYQVVSYTSRGFWDSGGGIEVAGPKDVTDARKVIDWALDNTDADPDRIGMAGISYGAGISLLTSAVDDRVKAVGAMSGWSDLAASIYPNETVSFQTVEMLLAVGRITGRLGDDLEHVEDEYRRGNLQPALDIAPERSAATKIDLINANDPAVMIAHAWNDGIFPPGPLTDFYSGLSTDKRLMLTPGDHATPEAFGAFGLPNETWESLTRWFDHHLRGVDNGIDAEDPVRLKPNNGSGGWVTYPDWESVTATTDTHYLTEPRRSFERWQSTGGLSGDPATGWDYDIRTGVDTLANSGTLLASGALQQFADIPTGVSLPFVNRYRAGVWTSEPYEDGATVSGAPLAHLTVTPSRADTSLFVYLYAVDRYGTGALITHKPVTLRDAAPGEPVAIDVELDPVVWDVPAGHELTLVVDTKDPRYTSESRIGGEVEFGSPEDDPSWLSVPMA
ncbi:putative acyl esterase [Spinactinospora alkalitolerans]|uniref:Putative acyl esterase n=1 Tax=Spinactinospora alkalitolerans TaxID=687207 RepID=A0A852TNZ1_9ACTN|nr:CocE/NonD family hydrolase [Spinactinospora alkalitolerans]NYE46076.1 putative acyl esterase [Spinactinospora alkalitolerans]